MMTDIGMAVANLHDAFLNASLVRRLMLATLPDTDPQTAHMSDRFRLERLWVGLLAVLVEAWDSGQIRDARDFLRKLVSTDRLVYLVRTARKGESGSRLAATRHYMFHRDQREYWDEGRTAIWGHLEFHMELHDEFGKVLLAGMRALTAGPSTDSQTGRKAD